MCCGAAGCAATWQLDAATRVQQHMLQVLVSHFGLNNSRGVKLLWLCRVWRRICSQLPVANCQWPVSSGCNQLPLLVLVAIAAASTHCCPFALLLPAPTADQRPNIAILPMPNILSICMSSLGFCLCFVALLPSPPPYLLLSDCPQKAAQQKNRISRAD